MYNDNLKNIYKEIKTKAKDTLQDENGHVEAICGKYCANHRRL